MSVGSNLQEMENAVTKGAAAAEPMQKLTTGIPDGQPSVVDLGGPTPENYRPDDDSAKLNTSSPSLAQVKNVVNKGAKPADAMPAGMKEESEEVEENQEIVSEAETTDEEVVSEEETTEEEVVAEATDETEEEIKEDTVEAEFSVEEDVKALLDGEDLSEEFQDKARTIFETAIKLKVEEVKEQIQVKYQEQLIEEVAAVKTELTERVDSYLEYVAQEWLEENKLAIEHGLKTEMTESFLNGMKSLFEEHYVSIPEEKYDVIESMVDKLDEMESKLNEQIEKNIGLNRRLAESSADVIFAEVAEGLAVTQKEKLASLAENVEFDSEETYREKLVTLRNSYFSESATSSQREAAETVVESSQEQTTTAAPEVGSIMEAYLQTLSRVAKN
ncbi:MAG: T4 prohead core scaffold protein [Euryarchaeota archaeon]|mgnify:CR=1 FL=1|jgi:hypothetical protein|nr:T4 prohead core scaffold protein [Euryarchaeota archaeon]